MPITKIFGNGNYFVVDIAGSVKPLQDSKSNVVVSESRLIADTWIIESNKIGIQRIKFSDIRDEFNVAYSLSSWDEFYKNNSGFNQALSINRLVSMGEGGQLAVTDSVVVDLSNTLDIIGGAVIGIPALAVAATVQNEGATIRYTTNGTDPSNSFGNIMLKNDVLELGTEQFTESDLSDVKFKKQDPGTSVLQITYYQLA